MLKVVFMRGVAIRSAVTAGTQMDSMTEAPKPAACTRPRKPVLSRLIGKTSRPGLGGSCSHTCPWRGQLFIDQGNHVRKAVHGQDPDCVGAQVTIHRASPLIIVLLSVLASPAKVDAARSFGSVPPRGEPSPRVVLLGAGNTQEEAIEATTVTCVLQNRGQSDYCWGKPELIICRKEGELPERVRVR
jgi:hypothetical protein